MTRGQSFFLGVFFCVVVICLRQTLNGFDYVFGHYQFTRDSVGTLFFWLVQVMLFSPACFLIGYALSPTLQGALVRFWSSLKGVSGEAQRMYWFVIAFFGAALAWLGNRVILQGFPITDDEVHVRYGGQLLAEGQLSAPLAIPTTLQYPRYLVQLADQSWTSFDWLGVQLVWALAEATRSDNLVFALCVGLTLASAGVAGGLLQGAWRWAVVSVGLLALSPMFVSMSLTTHAHVVSRCAIAASFACLLLGMERRPGWAFLGGLAVGFAGITRPVEAAFLLGPWLLWLVWEALRGSVRSRQVVLLVVLGALLPLGLTALHNLEITGDVTVFSRFSPFAIGGPVEKRDLLGRFGTNTGYNLLMLTIWFGGLPGLVLFLLGMNKNKYTILMSLGVCAILLVGIAHDNTGINLFGPIHYTECVVPLALVSGVGLRAALDWARRRSLPSEEWAAIFVIGFTLFSITINVYNLFQYHKQSTVHSYVFDGIRDGVNKMNVERAIVFAPLYWKVWSSNPSTKAVGAYVYDWPHPHPDGRDKIVYMSPPQNSLELEQVATRWPEHVPVFLRLLPQAPWMEIIPFQDALEEGGEKQ